ncbi:MAG TPA: 30S ribosomal protein S13 [Candidatus Pacebacteria bacterium]|nr:30S ribosomal protein S13 [Candidatus Paceibacterota bacterium]
MPRIAGIDIPDHKKLNFALRYIYGVGPKVAAEIITKARLNADKRARDLTTDEINRIQAALDTQMVEGDLRRAVSDNINRLRRIKAYRGLRHAMGLPVRGQRTRSNARTKRGAKRTIGAISKEAATKTETPKATK